MEHKNRATVWDQWHVNSSPRFPHEKVIQFVYRNYSGGAPFRNFSALDLGCGNGIHAELLAELGMSVIGVDVSSVALAEARARLLEAGLSTVMFEQRLLSELDFPWQSFDLIISSGVLDYAGVDETVAAASRLPNWLKPGGKAFLIFAAEGDFRQSTVKDLDLHCYTRHEVDVLFPVSDSYELLVDQYITTYDNDALRQVDWLITLIRKDNIRTPIA